MGAAGKQNVTRLLAGAAVAVVCGVCCLPPLLLVGATAAGVVLASVGWLLASPAVAGGLGLVTVLIIGVTMRRRRWPDVHK
jgi:hypothetical protein